jgi:hypothetical protein
MTYSTTLHKGALHDVPHSNFKYSRRNMSTKVFNTGKFWNLIYPLTNMIWISVFFFLFYTLDTFGSIGFVWVPSGPFYLGQTINPQRADWSLATSTTLASSSDHQPALRGDLTPREGSVHGLVVVYIPQCGSCLCSNRCFVTQKFCKINVCILSHYHFVHWDVR